MISAVSCATFTIRFLESENASSKNGIILKKKFIFKVNIIKKDYLKMIQKRYISTLLPLTKKELLKGMEEIDFKYKNNIKFNDKLTCLIL